MNCPQSSEQRKPTTQKPKTQQIKKGLQRIKQAQIQVLRQLRREEGQNSRNCSLSYSKQSTLDSKPLFQFEPQKIMSRYKNQKYDNNIKQQTSTHNKLKQDYLDMKDEAKKNKQGWQRAQIKMKQYQLGQQKALTQAQQALSNAIQSQKKYLNIKSENHKLIKEKQKLFSDLKKIQKKQIIQLLSSTQIQQHIPNKIIKQFNIIYDGFNQLLKLFHSHRCKQQDGMSPRNITISTSLVLSTYQIQSKVDHSINSILIFFHQIQNDGFINHKFIKNQGIIYNDKKFGDSQLENQKQNKKIFILEKQINQCYQQIKLLKNKNKYLIKQMQCIKKNKMLLQDQYEKYKIKVKSQQLKKQKQIQQFNKKQQLFQQQQLINFINNNKNIQKKQQRNLDILQDRIVDLQKQNTLQQSKITKYELNQKQFITIIQKLKNDITQIKISKQQLQNQYSYQINKLNTQINFSYITNIKNQNQWNQIIQTMKKIQQQRNQSVLRQNQLNKKFEKQTMKYQNDIKDLQLSLKGLRSQIDQLRQQNVSFQIDKTDLQRLRNQQKRQKQKSDIPKKKDLILLPPQQQFQPTSPTSTFQKFQHPQQTPRKSLDPSDRFLLSNPHTHSLMKLNHNTRQINPNQSNNAHQKHHVHQYSSIPISSVSPISIIPQSNPNLIYQPIQYQQCYVFPHRVNCQQNVIQK